MIRLSWRQYRMQFAVAMGLLAAIAVVLIATRPHLTYLFNIYAKAEAACRASSNCRDVSINLNQVDKLLELLGTALVAVPALVGAFWGAPLLSREFEAGTHRLAWTQSISRNRWLAAKIAVVGVGSLLATGLLSLMVTWWSSPIDRAHANRFGSGLFGERNIVPLGYAAFGFAVGMFFGLLIRRTLPAMASTLFTVLVVRIAFTYGVRPKLLAPLRESLALNPDSTGFGSNNGGPQTLFPSAPNIPNAWFYSTRVVDSAGNGLDPHVVTTTCPSLGSIGPPPGAGSGHGAVRTQAPADVQSALHNCVAKIAQTYHVVTTYQPANRYWPLQWFETGVFVAAAAAIIGLCFWWIRRRAN
jgi:ABC-type transport system involved in multi-copper enzyme maturation permease subunit